MYLEFTIGCYLSKVFDRLECKHITSLLPFSCFAGRDSEKHPEPNSGFQTWVQTKVVN